MKPEQKNLPFEDIAQTLRSAEFRRASDLSKWLRQFFGGRWLRHVASRGELSRWSALLSAHHRTS
jgi:hypothetical protein